MEKNKKMIKRDILDKFRFIEEVEADILPPRWLTSDYFTKLNHEEKKECKKAIRELISTGIVENINEPVWNLRLTRKGADLIY